ncbi:MAG: hypothetical protein JWP44_2019 [Mucilaginibacter sp.]|nr:hypothetical protein [Mucilaginibacter sp.]
MRSYTINGASSSKRIEKEGLSNLKHDINNQLSNIFLALEQLRYEIPSATEDCIFYLDSISMSTANINALLKAAE